MIKTARDRLADLGERVQALHPCQLPELIAVEDAGGSTAYLDSVALDTAPQQPRPEPRP